MTSALRRVDAKRVAEAMRKTLNLPHTAFPMRANAATRELELQSRCVTHAFAAQQQTRTTRPQFVLHDGPPFANGQLHMGHLLNKVLKDIINRYKLLRGFGVQYVPGWDCHGLPIEVKALAQLRTDVDRSQLSPMQVRKLSRALAQSAVEHQTRDFQRWGILADWTQSSNVATYLTMDRRYEAKQYDVLKRMVRDGLVFRGVKPVYWSPSSRTALAEAELEYADKHKSYAAYIRFPLHQAMDPRIEELKRKYGENGSQLAAVIWTTTPWTIPANMALCVNASLSYSVVRTRDGQHLIVASELVETFSGVLQQAQATAQPQEDKQQQEDQELPWVTVVETFPGEWLKGSLFDHPLVPTKKSLMVVGDHVTTDAGTGVVHTAPGHGQDDFSAWMAYHQQQEAPPSLKELTAAIVCPVDNCGLFTKDVGVAALEGLDVLNEGNRAVLAMLTQSGHLLHTHTHEHRYPYDWRTKQPVIVRATAQWFATLDTLHEVGKRVLETDVETVPKNSKRRLEATLSSRSDWCISRQRSWGLPIPVFYHKTTGEPLMTEESIAHIQTLVREYSTAEGHEGSDCWWDLPVEKLLPPSLAHVAHEYEKGLDTLDVWFDSGSSWHAVLPDTEDGSLKQANVYLEGSDQHRGWFQSSLLTSVALQRAAPYKHLITHGFVLDERGSKMSKSLGNTIMPEDFINGCTMAMGSPAPKNPNNNNSKKSTKKPKSVKVPAYGADVMRYWVATTDYTGDVTVGPSVIAKVSDALRKVRNTARFLLANLNDFEPERDAVRYEALSSMDKYMLHLLQELGSTVTQGYDAYAFNRVQSALAHFISADLSAFYMEASKDRLYCDGTASTIRRATQTVLWHTLELVTKAIAPVACHTAEDVRLHWQAQVQKCELEQVKGSIFTDDSRGAMPDNDRWLPSDAKWTNASLAADWQVVRQLRFEVNSLVEKMRSANIVGSQLECNVSVVVPADSSVASLLANVMPQRVLEDVLLCSGVQIVEQEESLVEKNGCERGTCTLQVGNERMEVTIVVSRALGHKCPRCWKYAVEVDESETTLCHRCASATSLSGLEDVARALLEQDQETA